MTAPSRPVNRPMYKFTVKSPRWVHWVLLIAGLLCGATLTFGLVTLGLILVATNSGAGHLSRHVAAAGKYWKWNLPSQGAFPWE